MKSVIVHYQEIALKGRNRPWFVARLVRNIREAVADQDVADVRALMGRIEVVLGPEAAWPAVRDRL
jgi:thiamine biosynthesis protein ThiI